MAVDDKKQCEDNYFFYPFNHLWEVLARSSSLRNLKIIFQNIDEQDFDQQV